MSENWFWLVIIFVIWFLGISPAYHWLMKRPVGPMHMSDCANYAYLWPISIPCVLIIMFFKGAIR